MSSNDSAEKEHEPSQKRLDDARARGEIARSQDLVSACSYGGFLLAIAVLGHHSVRTIASFGTGLFDQADHLAPLVLRDGGASLAGLLSPLIWSILPLFILPALVVIAYLLASRSVIFTPEKLSPKLSRISPFAAAMQKFGPQGLFEFGKSFLKLLVVSALLIYFLWKNSDHLIGIIYLDPRIAIVSLTQLFVSFLTIVVGISIVFGGVDFLWQRAQHIKKNRMSRKDVLDEVRDQDGDPHMKAQRRQKAYDIANNQMLLDVAKADVVIVNPTHFAVALKWNKAAKRAPICLAKGTDEIAARIRERAAEAGVPIHSDPPTARTLFATIDIGQEIRPEHYRTVAAAIRFAESMRKRARLSQK